jgi:hypothetical protein
VRRVLSTAIAIACLTAGNASAAEFQPDIDVHAPYGLVETTDGGSRSFVAFDSFVENVGAGPLKLLGQRASTAEPRMDVTQVLLDSNAVTTGVVERTAPAGQMEFSPSGSHNHWHYLRFEDYMLLSVPDLEFVAPTRKTGFCLVGLNQAYGCGGGLPNLLQIGDPLEASGGPFPATQAMGMIARGTADAADPNYSAVDHYGPSVEGQDIEITNLPDGRYCVSFVVDPAGNLVESSTANNGASRLIDIGTNAGGRTVAQGQAFQSSATCGLTKPVDQPGAGAPQPGGESPVGGQTPTGGGQIPTGGGTTRVERPAPMTRATAARLAKSALERKFRSVRSFRRSCRLTSLDAAACKVSFRRSRTGYRGTVSVRQKLAAGEWRWYYRVDVKRTTRPRARVRTKTLFGGIVGTRAAAARRIAQLPKGEPVKEQPGAAWDDALLCKLP